MENVQAMEGAHESKAPNTTTIPAAPTEPRASQAEDAPPPKRKRSATSEMWNHYEKFINKKENHKGDTIGNEIEGCLFYWGIEKVFAITVDNTSSNDSAIVFLKKRLKDLGEGLKDMNQSIKLIRHAIKFVRSSPSRLKKFKELVEKLRIDSKNLLTMDCPTRWNSTYIMLQNAIKFTKVFDRMEDEDQDYKNYFKRKVKLSSSSSFVDRMEEEDEDELGDHDGDEGTVKPPNAYDWSVAKEFLTFLELFYTMTLQFSGSNYVTSNTCFQNIVAIKTQLDSIAVESNSLLSDMAERMQSKYDKYWRKAENMNPLLVIAVILDPRYKFFYVEVAFKHFIGDYMNREMMKKKNMGFLHRLFDEYSTTLTASGSEPSETGIEMGESSASGGGKQVPLSSKKIIDVAIQDFLATAMSKRPKKPISEVE
ncbi:zinc finger BED domain-containing protein DAYSLEEPER-like [Prosopis cineraria]|uniref:zinc finger BED domain-containing protein DAYSLEEPER-like n=1 Tax=Prosopis cineraria TaxID=364024 RepID=UPI00240FC1B5|nr:zinc finger BED domain-containing protein DAYSLEEPER-like [Prosopis cineraria]